MVCIGVIMWKVQYKPNDDYEPWATLRQFDNKGDAVLHALRISGDYYLVKVTDEDDALIWISWASLKVIALRLMAKNNSSELYRLVLRSGYAQQPS